MLGVSGHISAESLQDGLPLVRAGETPAGDSNSALSVERHDPGREAGGVALAVEGQLSVADDLVEPVAAQQARELAELACRLELPWLPGTDGRGQLSEAVDTRVVCTPVPTHHSLGALLL